MRVMCTMQLRKYQHPEYQTQVLCEYVGIEVSALKKEKSTGIDVTSSVLVASGWYNITDDLLQRSLIRCTEKRNTCSMDSIADNNAL